MSIAAASASLPWQANARQRLMLLVAFAADAVSLTFLAFDGVDRIAGNSIDAFDPSAYQFGLVGFPVPLALLVTLLSGRISRRGVRSLGILGLALALLCVPVLRAGASPGPDRLCRSQH